MAPSYRGSTKRESQVGEGFRPYSAGRVAALAGIFIWLVLNGCTLTAREVPLTEGQVLFSDDLRSNAHGWDLSAVQSRWLDWSFTGGGNIDFLREPAALSGISRQLQLFLNAMGSNLIFVVEEIEVARLHTVYSGPSLPSLFVEVMPGAGEEASVDYSGLTIREP